MQSRPQPRALRRKGQGLDRPAPKYVLVFEGALGMLDPLSEPEFARLMKAGDYDGALKLWDLSDLTMRILRDRTVRCSQTWCLVTYLVADDRFARSLASLIGQADIWIRVVWAPAPAVFARRLITMPDIIRVYDPDPGRAGLYSPAIGRLLTDPRQLGAT